MSDNRLLDLKRAWDSSGSIEDEAAYLRERLRAGELTQERLELAALCGHAGAVGAAGSEELESSSERLNAAMVRVGPGAVARGQIAVARARLAAQKQLPIEHRPPEALLEAAAVAIAAAKDWVMCPCELHSAKASTAADAVEISHLNFTHLVAARVAALTAASHDSLLASFVLVASDLEPLQRELVPWTLGYADPLQTQESPPRRQS